MAKSNTLWTKTAFKNVPAIGATEKTPNDEKVAFVKLFFNFSNRRDYIIEYDPETGRAFVLTTGIDAGHEFGYISLPEMQEVNTNFRRYGFICPATQREIHGTPKAGYNIGQVMKGETY